MEGNGGPEVMRWNLLTQTAGGGETQRKNSGAGGGRRCVSYPGVAPTADFIYLFFVEGEERSDVPWSEIDVCWWRKWGHAWTFCSSTFLRSS